MYTGSLPAVSNKEDWIAVSPLIDEDGEEVTLTDATFEMFICKPTDPDTAILTASTANGKITLPTATTFQWAFTPDDMDDLCAGTYDVFLRVTIDDVVTQILSCTVPIVEGGPTS
jgi:hypothetical protein